MIEALTSFRERNNLQLNQWLDNMPHQNERLINAMRYGLLLGGKRVRPFLVYITGQMLGCSLSELDTSASAIECIHAYSLIHDDLPAMDDDDLRRGQPTCHKKFDEATAILTGDALQTLAFSILAEGHLSAEGEAQRINMIKELATASGAQGMCIGQALDLAYENQQISIEQLENVHHNKTGAIIKCAIRLGAYAAGDKGIAVLDKLDQYANAVGLAFQVQDDILDVISDTATLGKPQGSDEQMNKSTYPALLGIDGAIAKAQSLLTDALLSLEAIPYNTELLEQFARYVIERKH